MLFQCPAPPRPPPAAGRGKSPTHKPPPPPPPCSRPLSKNPPPPPADPNKPTPPKEETPPGAPEKYAFTAPEGQELDTSALAQFEPVARELNLTQEQAQKLVDVYPKVLAGVQQQQAESWQKQTEDWAAAVKADKDIGGDKLASNLGAAQRAIDTFGTKELKEYLDGTCARSLVNAAP
ncbi:peptidase [Salmonella enterica subsp. enterica serovar Enteritidis]|uniref:peptidase n=1 Tax=Salmonella enterica TaxID=28901 RepID=UPI00083D35A9|nr:peptidase [Salmonella enterica subsp. enterica serovar Enteritidis]